MAWRATLVFLSCITAPALASILAIDYGTDWTKASLVKPGIPFDVLLNKDSKRKIHSSVGWNRDDRLFGGDAFNIATRFPFDSFPSLKHVIGTQYESSRTWYYNQVGQGVLLETDRGTVLLNRGKRVLEDDNKRWTVEELIGMQFAYIKNLAEDAAGEAVNDVVLTVPPFFSQTQRQAVLDAVEIAGLRHLALINDGSAVAVNYAMTRSFPTKEHHIIYDAGAGSIRATVVSFHSPDAPASSASSKINRKIKTTTKESAHIEVKGFGWDTVASGNELTRRVKILLIESFDSQFGFTVDGDPKPLARLWKEAERVKGILSSNTETPTTIESLVYDKDFKTRTTRAQFEAACADLAPRFTKPIEDALESSGLTWDNITSVILTGGHSRVPMIQTALKALAESKLAHNVNTDESAVLGAAFYGASLSHQFRTKKIKLQDISPYDVQVSYEAEGKTGAKRTINTLIFPSNSKAGLKKTLTLKRKDDFSLRVAYKAESSPDFPADIFDISISNVSQALANLTSRGAADPVVKVTLIYNESGLVNVVDAVAFGEVKDDGSLTGKLKNLFGAGASSSSTSESSSDSATPSSSASASATSETPSAAAKKEANNVPLVWEVKPLSIVPLSAEEKAKSRLRLLTLDRAELAKHHREEALNTLEAYTYRLRDLLSGGAAQFLEFSTETERAAIDTLLESTIQWLAEESDGAEASEFESKKAALEDLEKPIQTRLKEYDAIPLAIKDLTEALNASRTFLRSVGENVTRAAEAATANPDAPITPAKYTAEEIAEVEQRVAEVDAWLTKQIESSTGQPKNVDAKFRARDVDERGIGLQRLVLRLINRKDPKPVKPSSSSTPQPTPTGGQPTASGAEEPVPTPSVTLEEAPLPEETGKHAAHEEL